MKKVAVYLCALMLGTSLSLQAQSGQDPMKEVRQVLMEQMSLPQNLKNKELDEDVHVKMAVDPSGQIEVIAVESESAELRDYVSKTVAALVLPENLVQDALTFSVNILFKVL